MEKIRVIISNQQKAVKIPTGIRMLIRRCCHAVLQLEGFKDSAEISVSFVDNDQIQEMNRQYRNIDAPTDEAYYLCPICGYIHKGDDFEKCPICFTPADKFRKF